MDWKAWINKEEFNLEALPQLLQAVYKRSLLIVRTNIDNRGAIIAANDSDIQHFARDTYSYMWPRDGAFTAYAMDKAGYIGITRKFFEFCLDLVSEGKEAGGYFLHKYNPDGCLGSSWHPWVREGEKILPTRKARALGPPYAPDVSPLSDSVRAPEAGPSDTVAVMTVL